MLFDARNASAIMDSAADRAAGAPGQGHLPFTLLLFRLMYAPILQLVMINRT